MNVDLCSDTNDECCNEDIGIVKTSSDDSQVKVINQKRDESNIPNQLSVGVAHIIESVKTLPQHHTRGIPKSLYEPKLSSRVKYPMSHYVSNHRLTKNQICHL